MRSTWSPGLRLALLVTLLSRLALPLVVYEIHRDPGVFFTPDGLSYLELAESIAHSGTYRTSSGIELARVPGFPSMLAIGVWLGHPVPATLALHLLLGLLTTGLCYAIGRDLAGERAGTVAALLYAIEPGQWVWSSLVLSETLFVALVAAMLWFALRYERVGRLLYLLLAILLAALSAYVRILGYALPFVLALWFGVRGRHHRKILSHVSLAVGLAGVLLGTWHVRNGVSAGYWGSLRSSSEPSTTLEGPPSKRVGKDFPISTFAANSKRIFRQRLDRWRPPQPGSMKCEPAGCR